MKFAGLKYFFFWGTCSFSGGGCFLTSRILQIVNRTVRRGEGHFDVIWCCFMGTCQWSCLTQRACIFAQWPHGWVKRTTNKLAFYCGNSPSRHFLDAYSAGNILQRLVYMLTIWCQWRTEERDETCLGSFPGRLGSSCNTRMSMVPPGAMLPMPW